MEKINKDDSLEGLASNKHSFGDQFDEEFKKNMNYIATDNCCNYLFGDKLEGELTINDKFNDRMENICNECLLKRESGIDNRTESGMANTTSMFCDACTNESGLCKCRRDAMASILRNHSLFRGHFENESAITQSGHDASDGIRCIECLMRGKKDSDIIKGDSMASIECSKCLIGDTLTNESGLSKSRKNAMTSIICTRCVFRDVLANEASENDVTCTKCLIKSTNDSNMNDAIPSIICIKCLVRSNIINKSTINENSNNSIPNIASSKPLIRNTNSSDLSKDVDDAIANIGCIKCFIRDTFTNESELNVNGDDASTSIVCTRCFILEPVVNEKRSETLPNLTCIKCSFQDKGLRNEEDSSEKHFIRDSFINESGLIKTIDPTPCIVCTKCMFYNKSGDDASMNIKCLAGKKFNDEAATAENETLPPYDAYGETLICSICGNTYDIDKSRGDVLTSVTCCRCMRDTYENESLLRNSLEDDFTCVTCSKYLILNKNEDAKTKDIQPTKYIFDQKLANRKDKILPDSDTNSKMYFQKDQTLHDIKSKFSSKKLDLTTSCAPCTQCSFVNHAVSCEQFVLNGFHSYVRVMDSLLVEGAIGAVKALSFVCDIITFPVYLVLQRPWQKKQLSRRNKAKATTEDKSTVVVHNVDGPRDVHCKMLAFGVDTMDKILTYVVKQFPKKNCLGTRQILSEEDELQPNGRVFKKYIMGDYKWRTYEDVNREASNFGRGLRSIGHQPKQNVVLFAETRAEWMVAAHACFKQNFPVVTLYATLGEDAIAHGINETEVNIVITSHDLLPKFKRILSKTPRVQTIVFFEDQLTGTDTKGFKPGVQLIPFKEVMNKGTNTSQHLDAIPPKKDDVAIIMYTSGSTGVPKGVLLTHSNMMATIGGFSDAIRVYSQDIFLGFLPLAHVFELLAESVCILNGVPIGYSTPLTMIDSSSKIKKGSKGDASVLHPTCLTAVPLILDRIYKGINDKVEKSSPLRRALFDFAFNYKKKWIRRGFSCPLIDKLIFGATKAMLGGNVRLIMTGGAPLSPDTHELVKICLCERVIQGYGLTETTSCATIMDHFDRSTGRAGVTATVCDVKLVNWDEGNYKVTDKPFPRGEIYVGGTNISPGYYKMPEKTKEDFFDQDGKRWFKTGDIGELHPDGSIKIIDRKKDLVKLQAGEYVSLGKVESELKTCPIVENICVYGDSAKDYCVALVVPNPNHLEAMAIRLGLPGTTPFENLCADPQIEKAVLAELAEHGKKCKLEKFEIPAAVKLCTEVWSPDMGLVTAAFKLKRKDIQQRYQHEINRMYGAS